MKAFVKSFCQICPSKTGSEKFAHSGDLFIREKIVSKIKQIQVKNWMQNSKVEEVE